MLFKNYTITDKLKTTNLGDLSIFVRINQTWRTPEHLNQGSKNLVSLVIKIQIAYTLPKSSTCAYAVFIKNCPFPEVTVP